MSTYNQLIHSYKHEEKLSLDTLRLFMFELCNERNINLYTEMDNEADEEVAEIFNSGVKRLLNDEPLNYILGYSYFYGYKMVVNEGVLIPRFETEELVGLVLSYVDETYPDKNAVLCDVGTGSGAIAVALKKEEENLKVYASDISFDALKVAEINARNNDADICFMQGSMLDPLIENNIKLDIIVSNPPYIKQNEVIENSVKNFEPHVALFGGDDGLKFYREILMNAHKVTKEHGYIFFEMGYDQKENLTDLAREYYPLADIEVYKDINKKDRMMMIRF